MTDPRDDDPKSETLALRRNDVELGLRFLHDLDIRNREIDYDHELMIYGLVELLIAKGVVSVDELKAVREQVRERVDRDGLGAAPVSMGPDVDKYSPVVEHADIDCGSRIQHCRAACCRLTFPLTKQDLDEGIVKWDYARPYAIKHRKDGWCAHNDLENHGCHVHAHRPVVCRSYNCTNDARIWLDFEKRIPHPSLSQFPTPCADPG